MRRIKKIVFSKIAWHCLRQEGRENGIFVHTICFGQIFWGPKQSNSGKTITLWCQQKLPKTKNDTFFEKGTFWDGKSVLTNCVLKSFALLKNTIFIELSTKHSNCNKKDVCWKTDTGFITWQNGIIYLGVLLRVWFVLVGWLVFFLHLEVLTVLWLYFVCLGKLQLR